MLSHGCLYRNMCNAETKSRNSRMAARPARIRSTMRRASALRSRVEAQDGTGSSRMKSNGRRSWIASR